MGEIHIDYWTESFVAEKNIYGEHVGSHEDATTSTAVETDTIPGNAKIASIKAITGDKYVDLESTGVASGSRFRIPEGTILDVQIRKQKRGGTLSYRDVS